MAVKSKVKRKPKRRKAKPAEKPSKSHQNNRTPPKPSQYQSYRESQADFMREQSARGRDIGPIPDIADIERRESCRYDLKRFCDIYMSEDFYLPWSQDQKESIKRMQETILHGALYAFAEPRGNGKTTRCRKAVLWAVAYNHRRFPVLIGANDPKATDSADSIKTMIRFSPAFAEDFPELSFPVRKLEGIVQRSAGQMCCGQQTLIEWSQNRIVLPTVPPPANWPDEWPLRSDGMVPTAGAIIVATGLTAEGIRGTSITLPTGETVRPDVVILDDPQTRESARSPMQNTLREKLISGDVLGMAGPGKTIAAMMPCTVIYPGDMVDRMLDRQKHPLWRGERTRMLNSFPKNMPAWEDYFDIYQRCAQKEPPDFAEANEHYLMNRVVLDAGASASWAERKLESEVSAIQSAMNLFFRDRTGFMSEYQNSPVAELDLTDVRQVTEEDLERKLNTLAKGLVPRECNKLTAFVDVQAEILFWAVCGWTERFGGALVDFGTFPPQNRDIFAASDCGQKLSSLYPKLEQKARVYQGLSELIPKILEHQFKQDGAEGVLPVSLCLIDSGFEAEAIHDYLTRSPLKAMLRASKGRGLGPSSKPMNNYTRGPGDVVGWNWRIDAKTGGKGRFVSFSTNVWKSFVAEAILAPAGAVGSFYLPGSKIREHPLLAMHLTSEYRTPTTGPWGRVEEWRQRPDQKENHWLDCVVGCAVAASVLGVQFSAAVSAGDKTPLPEKPKVDQQKLYEEQRRAFEANRRGMR